ncbi:hypothetical protein [Streptomyces cyaneochromogenes]|uniref:hypothetical protein n=1 Tax=Streptomyces cyaneochromogenes TaxID=2496836 RepID=UPI001E48BA9A|nr:hypothetical protein [Streptomyces cyaneochromogenes]
MTTHIERLVQQLDDATGPSYDARAELIDMGADTPGGEPGRTRPPELQALIDAVTTGHSIDLCHRIQRTTGTSPDSPYAVP